MGYGFGFRWSFRIVLFGFRFLFDPSGHYAPPLISNSRETSVCSTCQHRSGSIRVLRTGMWTFIGFDCFACGFRFWSNFFFFLRFCGCWWFFFLFRVLNYSRPCLVISSEIVWGILLFFFFFIFLFNFSGNKWCCLSHFTLEFRTESEGNVGWKLRCLCQTVWSCLCLHYHVLTFYFSIPAWIFNVL